MDDPAYFNIMEQLREQEEVESELTQEQLRENYALDRIIAIGKNHKEFVESYTGKSLLLKGLKVQQEAFTDFINFDIDWENPVKSLIKIKEIQDKAHFPRVLETWVETAISDSEESAEILTQFEEIDN